MMAEPEHTSMHNFAYHPGVASWVQSTALAQLNGASDEANVTDHSPDDFYKSALTRTAELPPSSQTDMTTTRQRQQTTNGSARSTSKPSIRSVSGPATSTASIPRTTPHLPSNRPTVKTLAQRFNQPSSAESSPQSSRARPVRPPQSSSVSSSPARPAKEVSYGAYKFNNLKPRDRPQPAPLSPAARRRVNGARASLDAQTTPSKTKLPSPTRDKGRQPFFGEVVGQHDATTPGYGIPSFDGGLETVSQATLTKGPSTIKIVTEDLHSLPEDRLDPFSPHSQQSASDIASQPPGTETPGQRSPTATSGTARKSSPRSRIPIASRRMSAASDSGSSTRSGKFTYARPVAGRSRASAARQARAHAPIGAGASGSPRRAPATGQQTLPSVSYRGYRERGKSPQGIDSGPSVAAVITAPPPPTSPRLRNSRDRQTLQVTPGSRSRSLSAGPPLPLDYFDDGNAVHAQDQLQILDADHVDSRPSVRRVEPSADDSHVSDVAHPQQELDMSNQLAGNSPEEPSSLRLSTNGLSVRAVGQPLSTKTSFEESPILGMPGSFMVTPPLAQGTPPMPFVPSAEPVEDPKPNPLVQPEGELLQPRSFQPTSKPSIIPVPHIEDVAEAPSELGVRESIPIMLGSDDPSAEWNGTPTRPKHQTRLSIGSQTWRVEPLDSTGTISYLEEDDSPTDPFTNRETLRPDDSASMAFYHQLGQQPPPWSTNALDVADKDSFTLDSEAYSVINKILNVYHESDVITPQLAQESWQQVQSVSPIVAQHRDWGSKEATETYLARLLSDAACGREETQKKEDGMVMAASPAATPVKSSQQARQAASSAPSIRQLAADPDEPVTGGTAIIFPPESRRYSRGSNSRASGGSTTTTIWEGPSRPDSSSGLSLSRDRGHNSGAGGAVAGAGTSFTALPKDVSLSISLPSPLSREAQLQLPDIASTGDGLGLSLQHSNQEHYYFPTISQPTPPRPDHSPPPPPNMGVMVSRVCGDGQDDHDSEYDQHPLLDHETPHLPEQPHLEPQLNYGSFDSTPTPSAQATAPMNITVPQEPDQPAAAGAPPPNDGQAEVDKTMKTVQKRYRVIEELCKTEHSFCVDMMVAHQIFEGTSREVLTDQDRRILFSNCKDLESFSHNLWKTLKDAIKPIVNQQPPEEKPDEPYDEFIHCTPENDRLVKVGEVMLAATPRMERVYTTYYLNYGDATDFIKKNTQNPELLGWVMACFQHCPNLTTAWDLDSLLIKPVQRMLRYPILLDQLIAATTPDHPDLPMLKAANEAIKRIAERIDLAKKRQQTLRAATSEGKKQKGKGISDRNVKSIVKAFKWSKEKSKTLQEAALIFEDQEYNSVTQKFGGHFFQIQIVIADLDQYLEALTESTLQLNSVMLGFITVSETGPSANAEMESTWRRWAMAHLDLQNKALEEHKTAVRNRVIKPISSMWDQWVGPQKLMEQRKKLLIQYAKYKQAAERKEKVDPKLEETAKSFLTINDSLKQELPMLYELTKKCIRVCSIIFIGLSKDWFKTCSKKVLPLLESEPMHTTSITYDFKTYVERFRSDFRQMEERARNLAIINHDLINSLSNYMSPNPTFSSDDASSRKSSSRRTESVGSEMSVLDRHNRNSGGYGSSRSGMRSFEGPPRSSPAAGPSIYTTTTSASSSVFRDRTEPIRERNERVSGSSSHTSEATVVSGRQAGRAPAWANMGMDGAFDDNFAVPASIGASFLNPFIPSTASSQPGSSRTSGVFNSALPMSDGSARRSVEDLPPTPGDPDEPEVLFLAASLFEFNIAHDRREGGIPYLVYVPGEIFDVIGMKGELWLARNQDDPNRAVGWIWEKHFARILPEDP